MGGRTFLTSNPKRGSVNQPSTTLKIIMYKREFKGCGFEKNQFLLFFASIQILFKRLIFRV